MVLISEFSGPGPWTIYIISRSSNMRQSSEATNIVVITVGIMEEFVTTTCYNNIIMSSYVLIIE